MDEEVAVEPTPPSRWANPQTPWIVASVATAVALISVTALITAAVVRDDNDFGRPRLAGAVKAARFPRFHGPVAGEIKSIKGATFTIGDTKVKTTSKTTFRETSKGALSDLAEGDTIAVVGSVTDEVFTADRIVEAPGAVSVKRSPRFSGLRIRGHRLLADHDAHIGKVAKIEGDTITLTTLDDQTVTVKTNDDTAIRVNKKITLKDLKVGDTVKVRPASFDDDTVTAAEVVKGDDVRPLGFGMLEESSAI